MTYTKNIITYGAPGTGKSFIGELIVLYILSQGLNVISSSLMGIRANSIGMVNIYINYFIFQQKIQCPLLHSDLQNMLFEKSYGKRSFTMHY